MRDGETPASPGRHYLSARRVMSALDTTSRRGAQWLRSRPWLALSRSRNSDAVLERALGRPRAAALVVDTMYRTGVGRPASPDEFVDMQNRAAGGSGFNELLAELEISDEAMDHVINRSNPATRAQLRRQFAASDGAAPAVRLVFLHIMKVGGTSLSTVLQRWVGDDRARVHLYVDDLVLAPPPILAQLQVLAGHIPFEAMPLIPGPFSTLCVLRDPVERTISHFAQLRDARAQHGDLTLDEFVHSDEFAVPSGNYQARQLAHQVDVLGAWRSYSPEDRHRSRGGDPLERYPLQSLFDATPLQVSDEELRQQALHNLAQIDYVGITDELEGVGVAVGRLFGMPPAPMPRLNVSPPSQRPQLDARIRRRIDENTAVDRVLYEEASRRGRAGD